MTDQGVTTATPFRPGLDDAEALALRAQVWGADHPHTSAAYFEWLFGAENPAGSGTGVMLRRGARLVGFAGLCPRLGRLGGRGVRVAHGLDYMVSPALSVVASGRFAHRTALEWNRIACDSGCDFGINFPNTKSRRLLTSDRLGWRVGFDPRLMVRPLGAVHGSDTKQQTDGQVCGLRGAALRFGLGLAGGAMRGVVLVRRRHVCGQVVPLDPARPSDAAAIDILWRRMADARTCGIVRDAAALKWRYGQHPLHRYQLHGWQTPGGALAALVVTTSRPLFGLECLLVADLLIDPAAPAASVRLIDAVCRSSGAQVALAQSASGDDAGPVLTRAGFAAVPARINPKPFLLVTMPLALEDPSALEGARWRFAWGDMDVV